MLLFYGNIILILLLLGSICFYVILKVLAYFVSSRLRVPPINWRQYLHDAVTAGANSLPNFGSKAAAVRRQLIFASPDISLYTNILPLSVTMVPKNAFTAPAIKDRKRKIIFGYFHPNADGGGGGERVLWAAVKQTLENNENNVCAVYLAPTAVTRPSPAQVLAKVKSRFDLKIDDERVVLIYLTQGSLIEPSRYPFLTMIGQAVGSAILAYEAISNLVPDTFIDTQGLPFCYPLVSWILNIPIMSYVHYPVVSGDMLKKLRPTQIFKHVYWRLLMLAYAFVGSYCTVVAVNSTWTRNHIVKLWWLGQQENHIKTIYPPCATQEFTYIPGSKRSKSIVYVSQFRPEKRHTLLIKQFSKFIQTEKNSKVHLILIGSARDEQDKRNVDALKASAQKLGLTDENLTIVVDAPWESVLKILESSWVGVNTMWNEHFGMGVVEYMAAGLIPVAHASAGPLLDIVGPDDLGFLFKSPEDPDYSHDEKWPTLCEALDEAFSLNPEETENIRAKVHEKASKFSDQVFAENWNKAVEVLIKLNLIKMRERKSLGSYD